MGAAELGHGIGGGGLHAERTSWASGARSAAGDPGRTPAAAGPTERPKNRGYGLSGSRDCPACQGVAPLEWRLLTNRSIAGLDEAVRSSTGTMFVGKSSFTSMF